MARIVRLLLALLLAPLCAMSQNDAPTKPLHGPDASDGLPPRGKDRRISLDVQVADKSGAPIRGLQAQDFTVLDNKQPQKIASFSAVDAGVSAVSDPPVEIVLVVDAINIGFHGDVYERDGVKKFLLQNEGKLTRPVSLIFFTEAGTKIPSGSSRDGNALAASYDQYETGLRSTNRTAGGLYGAEERISLSLKALTAIVKYEATLPGRKLTIWLSRGWPLLTESYGGFPSKKDEDRFFHAIVSASTGIRDARITLYSIDPIALADAGGTKDRAYEAFLKGVASPSWARPGALGLQVLAVQSGGRVLNVPGDLTTAIANCIADADAFYAVSFDSLPANHADDYRSLQITVDKPGITARTSTGYYGQP
jgi:VWFA-related protein